MGKKILRKAEELTDEKIDTMTKFNAEICKLKHVFIDKEFKIMKENADQRHRELIETIQELKETIKAEGKDTHEN